MPDPHETLIYTGGDAIKSLSTQDGKMTVGALAIRFTGPSDTDRDGEYFTDKTYFGARGGDGVDTIFHHGMPVKGLERLQDIQFGPARTRRDAQGVHAETDLDLSNPDQARMAELCVKGRLKWSSGSARHLVRYGKAGEITRWPISEFSFTPAPVDDRLPAISPLKALPELDDATAAELTAAFTAPAAAVKAERVDSAPRVTMPDKTPAELAAEKEASEKALREAGSNAVKARDLAVAEILAAGKEHNCLDDARQFISDGKSPSDFNVHVLKSVYKARPIDLNAGMIGADPKEIAQVSFLKAIRDICEHGKLEGREKAFHEAAVKATGRTNLSPLTFLVAEDVMRAHAFNSIKAQIISTATAGGFLMEPQFGPLIELLRNKTVLGRAGCTQMGGLTGDMLLPVQTGAGTAYWVAETGALTDSQSSFGQKKLSPHRIGLTVPYSTQFIKQTSIDAESFIRNDADQVINIEKDRAGLHGTGADGQPLGLFNSGIQATITYSGGATWAKVVKHETDIVTANADIDTMKWILAATTVGKWKTILKDSVANATYLIGEDMKANGYDVLRTNQIAGNLSLFGAFSQFIQASWSGREIIVDPFALKKSAQVEITFNELVDNLCRQPSSFNASTDSAAQ